MIKGLRNVFYWVDDMDASIAFYRDTLGLPLRARYGDDWAELDVAGATLALHGTRPGAPSIEGATVVFEVDDLDDAMASLSESGVAFEGEVVDIGSSRFVSFRDPRGNLAQLLQVIPGAELKRPT